MAAAEAAMRALVHATVLSGQRSQNQKQQSVRGGMQSKVEKAVDEHREATGQRSRGHTAPELVVRFATGEPFAKKKYQKSEPEDAAQDASVGKCLQIVVVCLLETIEPVPRVVACIDHSE